MEVVKILLILVDLVVLVVDQNMMAPQILVAQDLEMIIQDHHQTLHHQMVGVMMVVLVVLAAVAAVAVPDLLEVILLVVILVDLVELEYKFHQHSMIHPIL